MRSLLQSISIFRMRELEDARSLAGLAMDIYSDRISIDQAEQERLRFSADDITHLPVHTAINLWVAGGIPRAGFVAGTLPMPDLFDPALAEHHLAAQRQRGGRHLTHLPAPLGDKAHSHDGSSNTDAAGLPDDRDKRRQQQRSARAKPARLHEASPSATQLPLEEL